MSVKRDLMKLAGYSVSERSAHVSRAWDWNRPGKGPMDSRHFKSEEAAWLDAEEAYDSEVARARELITVAGPGDDAVERLKAAVVDTLQAFIRHAHVRCLECDVRMEVGRPVRRIFNIEGLNIEDFAEGVSMEMRVPGIFDRNPPTRES